MKNRAEIAIRAHALTADADRRLVRSLPRGRWVTRFSFRPFVPPADTKPGWWMDLMLRLMPWLVSRFSPEWWNYLGGRVVDTLSELARCSYRPLLANGAAASRVRS